MLRKKKHLKFVVSLLKPCTWRFLKNCFIFIKVYFCLGYRVKGSLIHHCSFRAGFKTITSCEQKNENIKSSSCGFFHMRGDFLSWKRRKKVNTFCNATAVQTLTKNNTSSKRKKGIPRTTQNNRKLFSFETKL